MKLTIKRYGEIERIEECGNLFRYINDAGAPTYSINKVDYGVIAMVDSYLTKGEFGAHFITHAELLRSYDNATRTYDLRIDHDTQEAELDLIEENLY